MIVSMPVRTRFRAGLIPFILGRRPVSFCLNDAPRHVVTAELLLIGFITEPSLGAVLDP